MTTALHLPVPPDVVDVVTEFPRDVLCFMTNRPAHSSLQSIKGRFGSDLFEQFDGVLQVPFNVTAAHAARAYSTPMPMMPPRRCPGCRQLVTGRRCQTCVKRADQRRGTAQERGYTSTWATFSKRWREQCPLCGMRADGQLHIEHSKCLQQGLERPAECVDHIDGHDRADDRQTWYDATRLQSLCLDCNRAKAIKFERGFRR